MQTQISSAVATSLANLAAIGAEVTALQEAAKAKRKDALQPFLDELAATGLVSIITVRGSTPGFNDGEPCEHSADIFVNLRQHAYEEVDETGDLADLIEELHSSYNLTDEEKEENYRLCNAAGHIYDAPPEEIMTAINALIFDTAEEENGTDYYVAYVLKDGKFVTSTGEYDCGY